MESSEPSVLLGRYVEYGCQEAFALLMRRYANLVYATALRRLNGDAAAAEDVTQKVFAELAAKAGRLRRNSRLGGWLYQSALHHAADLHKAETRRRARELKAFCLEAGPEPALDPHPWEDLVPELDEAIQRLPQRERDALVLRFFEEQSLRAIGEALGVSEGAAQKCVTRALERLRRSLGRRGTMVTGAVLASALAAPAAVAAPPSVVPRALRLLRLSSPSRDISHLLQAFLPVKGWLLAAASLVLLGAVGRLGWQPTEPVPAWHSPEDPAAVPDLPVDGSAFVAPPVLPPSSSRPTGGPDEVPSAFLLVWVTVAPVSPEAFTGTG